MDDEFGPVSHGLGGDGVPPDEAVVAGVDMALFSCVHLYT